MKKIILFLTFLSFTLYAQKAIELKPGGEVFPRVSLTSTTDNVTVGTPSLSQMVYNINTTLADGAGYYFWNGTNWTKLGTGAAGTLPSTTIVLSETPTNSPLQNAGFLNSGKAMIPFQGWERLLNSNNEFSNNNAENCLIYETNTFWAFWGGGTASPYLNTGKYYNPTSDTWTTFPAATGIDGRYGHAMGYNGSNLIIWGGHSGSQYLSTGLYIPFTSTGSGTIWTQMDNNGAPTARYGHSMVLPFIWGGRTSAGVTNTGKRIDFTTNPIGWGATMPTAGAPSARYNHIAFSRVKTIPPFTEYMYVWGGQDGSNNYLNDGGIYNITSDSWSSITNVNSPLNGAGVSISYKSVSSSSQQYYIAVTGGISPNGNNGSSTVGKYYNGTWNDIPALNAPKLKSHSSVIASVEGKTYLILWGGQLDNGGSTYNNKVYTFSITDNIWLEPADAQPSLTPSGGGVYSMVWDSNNNKVMAYTTVNTSGGIFNPLKSKPYYLFKKQ